MSNKLFHVISFFFPAIIIIYFGTISYTQSFFVPKVGWSIPLTPPKVDSFLVDNGQGTTLALDLRSSRKPFYFNPGIYLISSSIDVLKFPRSDFGDQSEFVLNTNVIWLKVKVGWAGDIIRIEDKFNIHLRAGLSPGFVLIRPNFHSVKSLEINYRKTFIELHYGIGVDYKKVVIDLDYHLSLVRRIYSSDIVENTLVINFGFLLD